MARILMVAFSVVSLACISLPLPPAVSRAEKPCCSYNIMESKIHRYDCSWYGTAFECHGWCPDDTVYVEQSSMYSAARHKAGFGSTCWHGVKMYCCKCDKNC